MAALVKILNSSDTDQARKLVDRAVRLASQLPGIDERDEALGWVVSALAAKSSQG